MIDHDDALARRASVRTPRPSTPWSASAKGCNTTCSRLLRASVLCPGFVATNIVRADRNRPADMKDELRVHRSAVAQAIADKMHERNQRDGQPPESVADAVFDAAARRPEVGTRNLDGLAAAL